MPVSTPHNADEKELLLRLQEGDHEAFGKLYDTYHYNLVGHLIKLLKSTELAKEVAQDTFMALWEHRDRIDVEKPVKPYLFKIAGNNAFNIFKKAQHDQKYRAYLLPIIEAGYEHIEPYLIRKENENLLQEILQKMPDKQRKVYKLCKLEGRSYIEVSEEMNISPNTIHTHIKRSNRFIRNYISNHPEFAGAFIMVLIMDVHYLC